jgi:RNA polymerase sigma factor (sigma-70 family)
LCVLREDVALRGRADSDRSLDFEMFCHEEYPRLVGSLGLYCGDREVAEELAQEALARAWRQWKTVAVATNPSAWTHAVGFNLAKSHFRRLASERRANQRLVAAQPHHEHVPDQAEVHAIRQAVAALPHRYKVVLLLRYYLGMTFPEIAAYLAIPLSTAKTWASRGISRLRRHGVGRAEEAFNAEQS